MSGSAENGWVDLESLGLESIPSDPAFGERDTQRRPDRRLLYKLPLMFRRVLYPSPRHRA
jgi:hypothetical protein